MEMRCQGLELHVCLRVFWDWHTVCSNGERVRKDALPTNLHVVFNMIAVLSLVSSATWRYLLIRIKLHMLCRWLKLHRQLKRPEQAASAQPSSHETSHQSNQVTEARFGT